MGIIRINLVLINFNTDKMEISTEGEVYDSP